MTDHNLEKSENKGSICLITSVCGYTLLVFKDRHGYQVDAIAPNSDRYCNGEIFYRDNRPHLTKVTAIPTLNN